MPEKSPPFFRENQSNQQNSQSSQIYKSGPNLILKEEILPPHFFYIDIFYKVFRRLSFFIMVVFGAMLLANFILDLKLESQRKMTNQLADEVGRYTAIIRKANDIDAKTKFYENTLTQRYLLGDKAHIIFSNIGPDIKLLAATVTLDKFTLQLVLNSPRDFAEIMTKYLESDRIASVTIRSAELNTFENTYKVSLEGTYK